jgi:hypothetical protein
MEEHDILCFCVECLGGGPPQKEEDLFDQNEDEDLGLDYYPTEVQLLENKELEVNHPDDK